MTFLILGLTTSESVEIFSSNADLLRALVRLTEDECFVIAKDASFSKLSMIQWRFLLIY